MRQRIPLKATAPYLPAFYALLRGAQTRKRKSDAKAGTEKRQSFEEALDGLPREVEPGGGAEAHALGQ